MRLVETDRSVELSNLGDVVQMKFPGCPAATCVFRIGEVVCV